MPSHAAGTSPADPEPPPRPARVPRDVVAGLFLIALAAVGWLGTRELTWTEGGSIGPGLMPRTVMLLIAGAGLLILLLGLGASRVGRERWSLRGPLLVLGAVVVFAAGIRPLGLAIVGPLAVLIAALADPEQRPLEILVFTVVISLFCIGLFKYALRLPIPLAPMLLGY